MSEHTLPHADLSAPNLQELLVIHRAATGQLLDAHSELVELVGRLRKPAQMETVTLSPQQAVYESRERFEDPCLSIGLLNPNAISVYFSTVGSAAPAMRSPAAPPNSLIVLPIAAQQIEVGASVADLAGATAVLFLFRFFTVQAPFLARWS